MAAKAENRCKCWHDYIARNSNVYKDFQCGLERGHTGHCKWAGMRTHCDAEHKAFYERIDSSSGTIYTA